ncbi:alpha/beta hydrolase [Pontimicrobium sp. IMCC45349]|uniref:alpha/beta hydrolase n=1 Tax=Pontimicrobium sp. IMCC45349 TaxID=3391574 RepID=UPI0039A0AC98
MNSEEKEISYQTTNSYSTLNKLTEATKNVWLVCHGMSYLSRYFLKYFKHLNPEENYIIAPQAPSKSYIKGGFKHVGANWLTKENTLKDTENILRYIDAVLEAEQIPTHLNLIVAGYSQGVSIASRYVARRQLNCNQLVLMSGGIPKEFVTSDFGFLTAKVKLVYGTSDEYLNDERMVYEKTRAEELFTNRLEVISFEGNHIVNTDIINSLV